MEKMITKMDVVKVSLVNGETRHLLADSSSDKDIQKQIKNDAWITALYAASLDGYSFAKAGKVRARDVISFEYEGKFSVKMV